MDQATEAPQADQAPSATPNTLISTPQEEKIARPDWLPEKFWVDDKPAVEQLAKSYAELEKNFRGDDFRAKIIDELSEEALAARPESPDKYELPKFDGVPEDAIKGPLTEWWQQFAYDNAFDNETFQVGIAKYLEAIQSNQPDYDAEMKALGENAKVRTEAVGLWVNKNFTAEERPVIEQFCSTAKGVKVIERVMALARGDATQVVSDTPTEVTEDDVKKMMNDRRYWHPADRDPKYIAEVQSFFQRKFNK
jgi:hypothetical protein